MEEQSQPPQTLTVSCTLAALQALFFVKHSLAGISPSWSLVNQACTLHVPDSLVGRNGPLKGQDESSWTGGEGAWVGSP